MTQPIVPAPVVQAAAPAVPAAAPPAPPPQVEQPAQQGDPNWLGPRIAQAKKSAEDGLLKSLGVTTVDEAKAAIAAKKAADDANKSAGERLADLSRQVTEGSARNASLEATIKQRATTELAALTEPQRAAVIGIAGEDASAQLRAIDSLKPTWAPSAAAPAAAPQAAPGRPVVPAPVTTTAAGAPPATPGAAPVPTNPAEVFDDLKKKNPMVASAYYEAHAAEITEARKRAK